MGICKDFHIILYIIIFNRIALESLGIIVSNDLLLFFYIFAYINGQPKLYNCRSPPVFTNFWNLCWLEVFVLYKEINEEEIQFVANKFKRYMKMIIPNLALNFANKYKKQVFREVQYESSLLDRFETSILEMIPLFHSEFRIENLEDGLLKEKIIRDFNIKEKQVLEDMVNKIPEKITAKRLNTTVNYIKKIRGNIRKEIKLILREEK